MVARRGDCHREVHSPHTGHSPGDLAVAHLASTLNGDKNQRRRHDTIRVVVEQAEQLCFG